MARADGVRGSTRGGGPAADLLRGPGTRGHRYRAGLDADNHRPRTSLRARLAGRAAQTRPAGLRSSGRTGANPAQPSRNQEVPKRRKLSFAAGDSWPPLIPLSQPRALLSGRSFPRRMFAIQLAVKSTDEAHTSAHRMPGTVLMPMTRRRSASALSPPSSVVLQGLACRSLLLPWPPERAEPEAVSREALFTIDSSGVSCQSRRNHSGSATSGTVPRCTPVLITAIRLFHPITACPHRQAGPPTDCKQETYS